MRRRSRRLAEAPGRLATLAATSARLAAPAPACAGPSAPDPSPRLRPGGFPPDPRGVDRLSSCRVSGPRASAVGPRRATPPQYGFGPGRHRGRLLELDAIAPPTGATSLHCPWARACRRASCPAVYALPSPWVFSVYPAPVSVKVVRPSAHRLRIRQRALGRLHLDTAGTRGGGKDDKADGPPWIAVSGGSDDYRRRTRGTRHSA